MVQPKIRHLAYWISAHAHLKNEFTEDEKYQNLMTWLNCVLKKKRTLFVAILSYFVHSNADLCFLRKNVKTRAMYSREYRYLPLIVPSY